MAERWRRCSACKKDIALSAVYWVCSVSTCNRARTALVFCSVDCWEIHLPTERHREAWAVEARAPKVPDPSEGRPAHAHDLRAWAGLGLGHGPKSRARARRRRRASCRAARSARSRSYAGVRRRGREQPDRHPGRREQAQGYVREGSGFNTSDRVMLVLSDVLRKLCDQAIRSARRARAGHRRSTATCRPRLALSTGRVDDTGTSTVALWG